VRGGFHYAWVVLGLGVLTVALASGVRHSFAVLLTPLATERGWEVGAVSFAYFLLFVSGIPMGLVGGWIADRLGLRVPLLLSTLLMSAGLVLTAWAERLWQFDLAYGVMVGGATMLFVTLLPPTMTRWFQRYMGLAVGAVWMANGLGPVVVVPLLSGLIAGLGWRSAFVGMGLGVGALTALGVLFLRGRPEEMGLRPYGAREVPDGGAGAQSVPTVGMGQVLRTGAFWTMVNIHFLGCLGHAVLLAHIVRIGELQGLSAPLAAGLFSALSASSIASRFLVPSLVERWGGRRVLTLGYGVQGVAILLFLVAGGTVPLYLASMLFGLGYGAEMVGFPVLNRQYFGSGAPLNTIHAGEMSGALLGMGLGGWLGGVLYDLTGAYTASILLGAGATLLAIPYILTLPRGRGEALFARLAGHAHQ